MDFLEIKGLKKSFGQGESHIDVLKGIDMTINQGEFCVLLGPSGSGKSTLLNIIGGIDSLDEGELIINKHRLKTMKEKELSQYRRDHLGYIFQMYNLIPNLTVRENIEVGAYLSKKPWILMIYYILLVYMSIKINYLINYLVDNNSVLQLAVQS